MMNSGTGPAAAMSYPLGVRLGVPHGLGGGIFLPLVARYNVRREVSDYADVYETMADAEPGRPRKEKEEAFVRGLVDAWVRLKVPLAFRGIA